MCIQPATDRTELAEQQNEDHTRDDRRNGKGQVDQSQQQIFATELKLRDGPGCCQPEQNVQRNGDCRGQQCQFDRADGVRVFESRKIWPAAGSKGLGEDSGQWKA